MANLTKEQIREYALSHGADLCGFANIERFKEAPEDRNPLSLFPEAKTVIVIARRIVRGGWRGIEEGTYWPAYTHFDYAGLLNNFFLPMALYELACFIEDHGWEAVTTHAGVPEVQNPHQPARRPGGIAAEVTLSTRIAGVAAGLGEMGWSKVFLSKKFGPRQRLWLLITDLELEGDPLVEPGSLCDRCMKCVVGCPGAIPHQREGKTVKLQIEDKTYEWGDVDMGKCTLVYHGGDPRVSPFIPKAFPGYRFSVMDQNVTEETAYKFCWPMATGSWRPTHEHPSGHVIDGHYHLMKWGHGGLGVEASRGCMRSCFNHLEKKGAIEQTFHGGDFIKRRRWLLDERGEMTEEGPKV